MRPIQMRPRAISDRTASMYSSNVLPPEEMERILKELAAPFPPEDVHWGVQATTNGGTRGLLFASVRRQLYTKRLDQIVGVCGWDVVYHTTPISGIQRVRQNRIVLSAKIVSNCSLTIRGVGTKSSTSDDWADQENASMRAEAKALKRACAGFGLGLYLYYLGGIWAPLDVGGRPLRTPELPDWALPDLYRSHAVTPPPDMGKAIRNTRRFIDGALTRRIESYRRFLGEPIYSEIISQAGNARNAAAIYTAKGQRRVIQQLEEAAEKMRRLRTLARELGDTQLIHEMNILHVPSAFAIPTVRLLEQLVDNLDQVSLLRAA